MSSCPTDRRYFGSSPPAQSAGHYRSATPGAPTFDFEPPTAGAVLEEVLPLIGVVAMAGPPVVFIVVPWVLFALMLVGPFLLLVTADLDRPTRGMIRVPDTALTDQLASMEVPPAAAAPRSP